MSLLPDRSIGDRLPRKRKGETGRAGVDRPPMRLWRTEPKYCPRAAIWVGIGSEWDNPWRETAACRSAHIILHAPPLVCLGTKLWTHRRPTVVETALALAYVFEIWLRHPQDAAPKSVTSQIRIAGIEPWSFERIRSALSGRDLVCTDLPEHPSHADTLLSIANSAGGHDAAARA